MLPDPPPPRPVEEIAFYEQDHPTVTSALSGTDSTIDSTSTSQSGPLSYFLPRFHPSTARKNDPNTTTFQAEYLKGAPFLYDEQMHDSVHERVDMLSNQIKSGEEEMENFVDFNDENKARNFVETRTSNDPQQKDGTPLLKVKNALYETHKMQVDTRSPHNSDHTRVCWQASYGNSRLVNPAIGEYDMMATRNVFSEAGDKENSASMENKSILGKTSGVHNIPVTNSDIDVERISGEKTRQVSSDNGIESLALGAPFVTAKRPDPIGESRITTTTPSKKDLAGSEFHELAYSRMADERIAMPAANESIDHQSSLTGTGREPEAERTRRTRNIAKSLGDTNLEEVESITPFDERAETSDKAEGGTRTTHNISDTETVNTKTTSPYTMSTRLATSLSESRRELENDRPGTPSDQIAARRNKRLIALKNLRSSFRKVVENQATEHFERSSKNATDVDRGNASTSTLDVSLGQDTRALTPLNLSKEESFNTANSILSSIPSFSPLQAGSYRGLRKQLDSAQKLIDVQREQIQLLMQAKSSSSLQDGTEHTNDVELRLRQLELNRAGDEFRFCRRAWDDLQQCQKDLSECQAKNRDWQRQLADMSTQYEAKIAIWKGLAEQSQRELSQVRAELIRLKQEYGTKDKQQQESKNEVPKATLDDQSIHALTKSTDSASSAAGGEYSAENEAPRTAVVASQRQNKSKPIKSKEQTSVLQESVGFGNSQKFAKSRKRFTFGRFLSK